MTFNQISSRSSFEKILKGMLSLASHVQTKYLQKLEIQSMKRA